MDEGMKTLLKLLVVLIISIFIIPTVVWKFYGEFTFDIERVMKEQELKLDQEDFKRVKEYCDFDVVGTRWGYECHRPCMKHSLDDKNCVPKGCVDVGFWTTECDLYVCEGFGDVTPQCLEHYRGSKEDYCKEYPEDEFYCRY